MVSRKNTRGLNPYMLSGLAYLNFGPVHFQFKGVKSVFIVTMFYRNLVFNANSVDPDQMPHSAASDLGLHCLSVSLLWDAWHRWVKLVLLCP